MSTESGGPAGAPWRSRPSGGGPRDAQRVRASDAEREQVAQVLRAAMTEGRLSLADGEERTASCYAATFRDELTPLVADLPGGGWHALADTPEARTTFRRYRRGRVGFVVFVAAVLIGLWLLSGASFFWPAIPLIFLGLVLLKGFCPRRSRGWYGAMRPPWARV